MLLPSSASFPFFSFKFFISVNSLYEITGFIMSFSYMYEMYFSHFLHTHTQSLPSYPCPCPIRPFSFQNLQESAKDYNEFPTEPMGTFQVFI